MKNIRIIIILLFMITLISNVYALDKTIKSASELSYPPFSIVDSNGNADGFSVELLRAALKTEGFDVTFYVAPWDQIKQELADGKIQVLPVVGRTPEREKIYDFTKPYLTFYGAIFVRQGDTTIKTEKDLTNKEVVVMKGDNAEEYARRENISSKIITTSTYEEAFNLLSDGKYDAIIAKYNMGNRLIKQLKIKNVAPVNYRLDKFKQEFTFAVKEGDPELLDILNKGLDTVIEDGTFYNLQKKWFVDTEIKSSDSWVYLTWLLAVIIIIIIITAVSTSIKKRNKKK